MLINGSESQKAVVLKERRVNHGAPLSPARLAKGLGVPGGAETWLCSLQKHRSWLEVVVLP